MSTIKVRELSPEDWQLYKNIRLKALLDSPKSFGSSHELEVDRTKEEWEESLDKPTIFVAFLDNMPTGLIGSHTRSEYPTWRYMFSMWVDPNFRNLKIGKLLVEHFIDWARNDRATKVVSGYSDENIDVFRFYEKLGFKKTGEKKPLSRNPSGCEYVITLDI